NLHAISAGSPTNYPEFASSSFFNFFPRKADDEEEEEQRIGLFAETLIFSGEFKRIMESLKNSNTHNLIKESFDAKKGINLICTSMGDFCDEHDLLRLFLTKAGVDIEKLLKDGWIGSVQYRGYRKDGPVEEKDDQPRAFTLFELKEFVDFAERKDH